MNFCFRQILRRIEVSLIEYRESLEDRGIKDVAEIEKKVAIHRKHLESEFGLVHSNENAPISSKCSFNILLVNQTGVTDDIGFF